MLAIQSLSDLLLNSYYNCEIKVLTKPQGAAGLLPQLIWKISF